MKKIMIILIALTIILNLSIVSFAATTGGSINLTTEETPATATYLKTENIPLGTGITSGTGIASANKTSSDVTLADEKTPKAALPKTGGIPEEMFYVIGALLIVTALILSMKKSKTATK
jgi:LPXTG-motif cell wall-anchored protein